jgi:hypothetical protein
MKRFTNLMWAAVAVLGLYSPVFSYAGPFGSSLRSSFGGSNGGTAMKTGPSTSFGTMKSQLQTSGGFNSKVLNLPSTNNSNHTLGKQKLSGVGVKTGPIVDLSKSLGNAVGSSNAGHTLGKHKLPSNGPLVDIIKTGGTSVDPNAGHTLGKHKLPNIDLTKIGVGPKPNKPPKLDLPTGKFPGKIDPGKIDPGKLDPGGKIPPGKFPPGKIDPGKLDPGKLDPGKGGGMPPIDPGKGNGGGGMPPIDPGKGNGGMPPYGNGNCHHGGGKFCWPNYCLNWWWPTYYSQPYCGTVYLNGGWTYVTQPVAAQQISLVQIGDSLPEIPSNATFKMQVAGLSGAKGVAAVEVNGVGMQAELLEWNGDSVVVRLPAVGLTQPLVSDLYILQADGSMAKNLKFKMTPAIQNAVAVN